MLGTVVILKGSLLGLRPCFAYIFNEYTIGDIKGYNFMTLNKSPKFGDVSMDSGGLSEEEMLEYTIPYTSKSLMFAVILRKLNRFDNDEYRQNRTVGNKIILPISILRHLNENRLISHMRDYTIDQVIGNSQSLDNQQT